MKQMISKKIMIAIVAAVATVGLIVGGIVIGNSIKNRNKQNPTPSGTPVPTGSASDIYYEVKFANLEGTSAKDIEKTRLPETTMVTAGTKVSRLTTPSRQNCVFLGWSYDEDGLKLVGNDDEINSNMTLYPRFGTKEGMDGTFTINYVAVKDTKVKKPVVVASLGLPVEEVEKLIKVINSSLDEEVAFRLELIEENPEATERGYYTEEEIEFLESVGIGRLGFEHKTTKELKEYYGLKEDDSLERYWREDIGLDVESVILLQQMVDNYEASLAVTAKYYVLPVRGDFTGGELYSVELAGTERLRFIYNDAITGASVEKFNFSVFEEPVNNMLAKDGIIYIPADKVFGVSVSGGMYNLATDEQGNAVSGNEAKGILDFDGELKVGDTIAVYDGKLNEDGTVESGDIAYFKITGIAGAGKYNYTGAEFEDVIFIPDVIPVKDDGTEDGKIVITAADLDFTKPVYKELRLDGSTKVEVGDFIALYTGDLTSVTSMKSTGYGRITSVTVNGTSLEVTYTTATYDDILDAMKIFTGYQDTEIPVSEEQARQLRDEMQKQVEESGYAKQASGFLIELLTDDKFDPKTSEYADEIKQLSFRTASGQELSVPEVRKLAGGSKKVKVSDPVVNFGLGITLKHFEGKGIRAEFSVSMTIEIELNSVGSTTNKIEIQLTAALEQEIVLGLALKASSEWKWYAFIPVIQEVNLQASFRAGTFSGFSVVATVQTKSDNESDDKEWNELITTTNGSLTKEAGGLQKLGEKLETLKDNLDILENGTGYNKEGKEKGGRKDGNDDGGTQAESMGGGLADKYSAMLENDAEYIYLVKQQLFKLSARPDPFGLIEFSFEADFVVSMKINAMIGISITYGNAKQYCYNIKVFARKSTSTNEDLETPNFRTDFFAFGMIGFRVGVLLDARIGFISTDMDSIGVTCEVGLYAELYGFLYVFYEWESGKGSNWGAMGSLLFEVGAYLEINFVAQLGDGKIGTSKELYANKWPFVQLGATAVPLDFTIDEDDEQLTIDFPESASTVKLPADLYKMNMMAMDSGEVEEEDCDSDEKGEISYSFTINGRTYTQYSEEHFKVECFDLTGKDGSITANHSFQYLPATNEVMVKPVDNNKDEYWGVIIFTYLNDAFGFNTQKYSRKVYVHWKGKAASAYVEYYLKQDDGHYDLAKTGEFNGFDGIQYDLVLTDEIMYEFSGYRLVKVKLSEEQKVRQKLDALWADCERLYAVYKKTKHPNDQEAYNEAGRLYSAYNQSSKDYMWGIDAAVKNQRGTIYFPMVAGETTATLYFDKAVNTVNQAIIGDMNRDCTDLNMTTITQEVLARYTLIERGMKCSYFCQKGYKSVMNTNLKETMPHDIEQLYLASHPGEEIEWYYYSGGRGSSGNLSEALCNKDKWVPLTDETLMPDNGVCILGVPKRATYKVTWMYQDEVIKETTAQYGDILDLITMDELKAFCDKYENMYVPEGYTLIGWKTEDGTVLDSEHGMVGRDTVLTPALLGNKHLITCVFEDGHTETIEARTGDDIIAKIEPLWLFRVSVNYYERIIWNISGTDTIVEDGMTMPDENLTLIYKGIENKIIKITWVNNMTVYAFTEVRFGDEVIAPDISEYIEEDEVPVWFLPDGTRLEEYEHYMLDYWYDFEIRAHLEPSGHNWTTGDVIKEPTCTEDGERLQECCYCCLTRIIPEPATGHDFDEGTVIKAPTCSEEGIIEKTCKVCGHKEQFALEKSDDHVYGEPVYTWSADNRKVTAKHTCTLCGHVEEETVEVTSLVTKPATCEEAGATTFTSMMFVNEAFKIQKKDVEIPATGHKWGTPTYTWSADFMSVTATVTCTTDASHKLTETVSTTSKVSRAATYDAMGETTYTATFKNEVFKTQTKAVENIPQLDGTWNAPTYNWSADNKTVTATRTRTNDASAKETETVNTTSVVTEATCSTEGKTVYTATFTNAAFTPQTKTVTIAALGHDWDEGVWTKERGYVPTEDHMGYLSWHAGEKSYTCKRCGETKKETVKYDSIISCGEGGDWVQKTADGYFIDLSYPVESQREYTPNITFENFYCPPAHEGEHGMATIQDVIETWFSLTIDSSLWMVTDEIPIYPHTLFDTTVTIADGLGATQIVGYTGKTLTVTVTFTPPDTAAFTTVSTKVTFQWP